MAEPNDRPKQFMNPELAGASLPRRWAVYGLSAHENVDSNARIIVEVNNRGNVPENASTPSDLAERLDLDKELASVAGFADRALTALKKLEPGEVEISFGVELGGKVGIPLITSGEAKANLKVTLKWKNGAKPETPSG
jgi:Trypsin-co-occurring domain 1